jgi:hypothetical protein
MTTTQDAGFTAAMGSGNPQPYADCWARTEDVTLFGAWGPIEKGLQQLMDTFRPSAPGPLQDRGAGPGGYDGLRQ